MIVLIRATHTRFAGNGSGINHIYGDFFIDNLLLYLTGQFAPYFFLIKRTVQQEGSAGAGKLQHFHFLHKIELVAGYKIGFGNQVRRADRFRTEAQVRNGTGSGFFGVIHKISLGKQIRILPDDLNGVLIGTNGTIRTKTKEKSLSPG
jgi:hypothetical protein